MSTFLAITAMTCAYGTYSNGFELKCAPMQKYSIHIQAKLVREYEQFDYHPCKLQFGDAFKSCKKDIVVGCRIKLTDGTIYYSKISCNNGLR